ncbi:hypothetical protein KIW84_061232 [Lathyrus oleraceus]|uniref:Aminotransferase-like plant mobile domain-containing protein n=1 Tax=Pisum sativum TaxID=3888 RepID=A0A9D4W4F7_PEA|nr:hypothetical protein KIW84_061232 [Pisum sativum]
MITQTLLDITAITGLKPTSEVFDYEAVAPISLKFNVGDSRKPTYNNFIDHHSTYADPVAKHFALLATQLHQERDIALGQLILASLYESLPEVVCQIRLFDPENSRKKNVLVHGPFWFLQLWLNATFSKDIAPYGMRRVACPPEERHLIWKRIIPLTPIDKNFPDLQMFRLLFNIMLTRVDFLPSMAPFSRRTEGPAWLTRPFPPTDGEHRDEAFLIWRRLLVPRFLSTETSSSNPGLVAYQPNLVARQFGLCQFIPKSLFSSQELLANILYGQPWSEIEEELETIWKNRPRLPSLPFRPAYYCTKEFHDWWQSYFTIYVGVPEAKLSELTEAFVHLQTKSTKCKALHVKQIRAFQNYFQVVYRPDNLRGTIWEAAVELKAKVTDKLPKLKIPGYAKDKYLYALHFGNLKFPPLPSSPLALAFGHLVPLWFYCPISYAAPEKSSDDDERPIAQVLRKPNSSGQPRSTEPTVSSHSKKSKKHKRSAPTGSEVFLVGLYALLARISAYNLSSCLQHTSQHKSKSHHGHKRKKHDSPSRSGETK